MPLRRLISLSLVISLFLSGLAAWSGGFGARVGGGDLYGMLLSKHRHVAEAFAEGRFPLWNPYELAGLPLHAVSQGSVLYLPVALVNMAAEPLAALQILYVTHIFAYVLVVLLYLSRAGLGVAAAGAGALLAVGCFFNAQALVGNDHPLTLFPLPFFVASLIAWDGYLAGRRAALPLIAAFMAIQWLTGYPGLAMDASLLLLLVALLTPGRPVVRRTAVAVALTALGALLAGAHLLPLAEATAESARAEWSHEFAFRRSLFAIQSASFLADSLLGRYGAAGLFLLVLGLLNFRVARRAWPAALALCVFAMNQPLSLLYEIPPFRMQQHGWGWDLIEPFFAGCLAAAGLQMLRLQAREPPRGALGAVAPAAGLAVAAAALWTGPPGHLSPWIASGWPEPLHAASGAILAGVCAACGLAPIRTTVLRHAAWAVPLALVALHIGGTMTEVGTRGLRPAPDLRSFEQRTAVLRALRERRPELPRVVSKKELQAGIFLAERLPSATGYEPSVPPLRIWRLTRELGLGLHGVVFRWPGRAARELSEHPGAAAALGVGLVVAPASRTAALREAGFAVERRLSDGDTVLYRRAAPRFQVLHEVAAAAGPEESLRLVLEPDFDPARTVILESPEQAVEVEPPPAGAPERVRVRSQTPERIRLQVEVASAGVLVIADTWYPGWKAAVDGEPAPVLRANYAFRAVALGPGLHEVELRYAPRSFRRGCAASALGLALLAALAAWAARADTRGGRCAGGPPRGPRAPAPGHPL